LPSLGSVKIDIDLEAEFGCYDNDPSNGVDHKMILYMDHSI